MKILIRMLRREGGQALPMALILMFVGILIIIPILSLSTTNFKATQEADQRNSDLYAADAGINDGLWKVGHNDLPDAMLGSWNETTYSQDFNYNMYDNANPADTVAVNDRNVNVDIKPIWVLDGFETPGSQRRTPDDRLVTYGTLVDTGVYNIVISYDGTLGNMLINRIGCWLPPGFDYTLGSSNLEKGTGQLYHCIPQKIDKNGGQEITWDYTGIDYNNLPASGNRKYVSFNFTPSTSNPVDAFSWTRTKNNTTIQLSWDTSRHIFELQSAAPTGVPSENQTTIVAHSVRRQFQALGGAISGDYQATGNTVMRNADDDRYDCRERLYNVTSATIQSTTQNPDYGIPSDATVEKIFLYWSGWKNKPWDVRSYNSAQLAALPVQKYINIVALKVTANGVTMPSCNITASATPQVMCNRSGNDPHGWSYACFADITDTVVGYFKNHGVPFYGIATYTVGHWDVGAQSSTRRYRIYNWTDNHNNESYTYTRYPLGSPMDGGQRDSTSSPYYEDYGQQDQWSHAAWSVVIIYSSPSTKAHFLYVYDTFRHCDSNGELDFTIKGFLAPQDVLSDPKAARLTCFVGEGDSIYTGDSLSVDNVYMSDNYNPWNNVWNSCSNVLGGSPTDNGIDIDQFYVGNGIIKPGDTQATIKIPTDTDEWNLVYMVLSFYSEITTGGTIDYTIK